MKTFVVSSASSSTWIVARHLLCDDGSATDGLAIAKLPVHDDRLRVAAFWMNHEDGTGAKAAVNDVLLVGKPNGLRDLPH